MLLAVFHGRPVASISHGAAGIMELISMRERVLEIAWSGDPFARKACVRMALFDCRNALVVPVDQLEF